MDLAISVAISVAISANCCFRYFWHDVADKVYAKARLSASGSLLDCSPRHYSYSNAVVVHLWQPRNILEIRHRFLSVGLSPVLLSLPSHLPEHVGRLINEPFFVFHIVTASHLHIMETTSASSEARELSLVGKVEMRIALADSDGKLQTILGTFLPPLLLKLGSEHVTVRNKVISICQHVNTRTKPESVKLPVAALVEQFKAYPHTPLIRHFDLLYIQQGIRRMSASESAALFPTILQGLAATTKASATHGSQMFNFLLQVVRYFQLPDRGSKEDDELRLTLKLSDEDANFLAHWFGKLILLTPVKANNSGVSANNVACPGLTPEEYTFLTQNKEDTWSHSSTGLNLFETKVRVAKLLASGAFKDAERFLPALFASADPASAISGAGEDILKRARANISLEDVDLIRTLLQYYFGDDTPNGLMRVRMSLRFKILGLLEKSTLSTTFTEEIIKLVHDGIIHGPDDNNAVLRPDYSRLVITPFQFQLHFLSPYWRCQ